MGSRAVLLVCRSAAAALARFGVTDDAGGTLWTRTRRPFFGADLTAGLVAQGRTAAEAAGPFSDLGTSWLLLGTGLLPWSGQGGAMPRGPHAAVRAAARATPAPDA